MNPEFKDLADDIYRRRVLRARALTPGQRLSDSMEMTDFCLGMARAGVIVQHPEADEAEINRLMNQRRRRVQKMSDHGLFRFEPLTALA